jgi:hypothetical protein
MGPATEVLEGLPKQAKPAIKRRKLPPAHAWALLDFSDPRAPDV